MTIIIVIYLFLFILSIYLSLQQRKTIFTPIVLFSFIWCVFPAVSTLGLIGLNKPSIKTHIYILISVFSFYWSYFLVRLISKKFTTNKGKKYNYEKEIFDNNINTKLLIALNIIILIVLIPSAIKSFQIAQINGYAYLREIGTDALTSNKELSIIYQLIAIPIMLSTSCLVIAEQVSSKNRKNITLLLLVIINIILHSIVFAARALMVKIILYTFFGVFFCRGYKKKKKYTLSQKVVITSIFIGLIIFISYMTAGRNTGIVSNLNFIDSIIWYYIGPFSLFDLYIQNPDLSHLSEGTPLLFGTATFGFLYNLIPTAVSALLGTDYFGTDYVLSVFTRIFMPIGDGLYMNSGTTAMYPFLRDFGIVGLPIGFSFMGGVIAKSEIYCINNNSIRSKAIYIYLMYVLFKTVMNYEPISPDVTFAIIFIIIFTHKRKKRKEF